LTVFLTIVKSCKAAEAGLGMLSTAIYIVSTCKVDSG